MKPALKTTLRGALLAGLITAAIGSAQAYAPLGSTYTNGVAVAGFTTGSGNELIVNLGPIASLTNGEQWNLNTLLTGPAGSGDAGLASLNNLNWGVIGVSGGLYYSTVINNTSPTAKGTGQNANELTALFYSNGQTAINSSGYEVDSASGLYSWYDNVDQGNGPSVSPYGVLGGTPDSTTPASGSFTFAQDSATWYTSGSTGVATTNYFAFNSSGILMFTNLVASTTPPAPQIVAVTRSSTASTIYFTTANGFTYTLYYTNSAGLASPNWPASPTTLTGNGLTNSLTDTTAVANRFYRVSAH